MASAQNRDEYTAILVPWRLDAGDIVAASSTYTQDDPQPGVPSPTGSVSLYPIAEGDSDGTSYTLTTRQGGSVAPGGAGFTWRKTTDSAGQDRGWDAPNCLSAHSFIDHHSAPAVARTPDACELPNGNILVVASKATVSNHNIQGYILSSGDTVTEVDITGTIGNPTTRIEDSYHPTPCVMEDGAVIMAHVVEDTDTEQAQVNLYRSTDNAVTWSLVSEHVLPEAIDIDNSTSGTGYTIRRMRMRHVGGRTLLLLWVQVNNSSATSYADGYFQFGSDSEGTQFSLVEFYIDPNVNHTYDGTNQGDLSAAYGYPDLAVLDGGFYVSWIETTDNAKVKRLVSPFDPISGAGAVSIDTSGDDIATISSGHFTEGECAIAGDNDGALYVTYRRLVDNEMIIVRSSNGGDAWTFMGLGVSSTPGGDNAWRGGSSMHPENISMIAARAALYVYGNHDSPTITTYQNSLSEWRLGSWSSVTMPGNSAFGKATGRASWTYSYFPGELPGNLSEWTKTATLAPTESVATGDLVGTCAAPQRLLYTHTHSGSPTPAQGQIVEVVLQQASGGGSLSAAFLSGVSGFSEDASSGYEWQLRVTATTNDEAEIWDATAGGGSGAKLAGFDTLTSAGGSPTLDWSNYYAFRIEQRGANIQAWYRVYTVFSDRLWIEWGTDTLTSTGGSGSATQRTTFGPKHEIGAAAATTNFKAVRVCYGAMTGVRPSTTFTNPDHLFPRDYPGVGRSVVIDGNLRIGARGGPGRRGDTYTAAPRYTSPIDVTFWTDSLSMQDHWRSTEGASSPTCDQQTIVYPISDAGEDTRLSPVVGVFFGGIRGVRTASIILETHLTSTATYAVDFTFGGSQGFTRAGNTIVLTSAATSGTFLQKNEAMGWWIYLNDGGGTTAWVEVERNEEGVMAGGAGMPARFTIKDATTALPNSGTMYLVPTQAVVVINTQNDDYKLLKVDIDSQETPDGKVQIASIWPGNIYVTNPYESGARFTTVAGSEQSLSPGRVANATRLAPAAREFEIAWSAVSYTGATGGAAANPDWLEATQHANRLPASVPEAIPYSAEGLFRYCNGERPIALITNLPRQGSGAQSQVVVGRWRVIPAQITGTATVRDVAGMHGTPDEKKRMEALALRELV